MTTHHCSVQEPWFTLIQAKLKTVEGRLNSGAFATFRKGDHICWSVKGSNKKCTCTVVDSVQYDTFASMLDVEGIKNVLPGVPDVESGVKVYRQFYTREREEAGGVRAIHLRVSSPHKNKRRRTIRTRRARR